MPKPVSRLPPPNRACTFPCTRLSLCRSFSVLIIKAETLLHFTDVHRYVPLRVKSATSASAFPTDCRPWLPEVVPRFLATMAAPTPAEGIDGPFILASLDGPPTFTLADFNGVV